MWWISVQFSCSVVSSSLWPLGLQPSIQTPVQGILQARILENTGVGSHFLLQGIFPTQGSNLGLLHCRQILYRLSYRKVLKSESRSVVFHSLWPHELYSPWNSSGQNAKVDNHSLLQRIFPTPGSNPGLRHCRQILNHWTTREASVLFYFWPFSSFCF